MAPVSCRACQDPVMDRVVQVQLRDGPKLSLTWLDTVAVSIRPSGQDMGIQNSGRLAERYIEIR